MPTQSLLEVGVVTDRGRTRPNNQDTYGFEPIDQRRLKPGAGYIALVADGVGGGSNGADASRLAREEFISAYFAATAGSVPDRLQDAAARANSAVYARAQELGGATMATTLVAAAILPTGQTHIVNIGDSRAYLYKHGQVRQITTDHNMAALVQTDPDAAPNPQAQNTLTRCIGALPDTTADAFQLMLAPGEHLLLCTDGLTKHLANDAELEKHIRRARPAQATAAALVDLANERGGTDNITVMLIKFGADHAVLPSSGGDDQPTVIPGGRRGRGPKIANPLRDFRPYMAIIAAVILAVLAIGIFIGLSVRVVNFNPFAMDTATPVATALPKAKPTKPATETRAAASEPTAAPPTPSPIPATPQPDAPTPEAASPTVAAANVPTIPPATPVSGSSTPVAARTAGRCIWTVKEGDLIDEIAKAILRAEGLLDTLGVPVKERREKIAQDNKLENADTLPLGKELNIEWPDQTKIVNGTCPQN